MKISSSSWVDVSFPCHFHVRAFSAIFIFKRSRTFPRTKRFLSWICTGFSVLYINAARVVFSQILPRVTWASSGAETDCASRWITSATGTRTVTMAPTSWTARRRHVQANICARKVGLTNGPNASTNRNCATGTRTATTTQTRRRRAVSIGRPGFFTLERRTSFRNFFKRPCVKTGIFETYIFTFWKVPHSLHAFRLHIAKQTVLRTPFLSPNNSESWIGIEYKKKQHRLQCKTRVHINHTFSRFYWLGSISSHNAILYDRVSTL